MPPMGSKDSRMHRHFQPGIWQPTVGNARTRRDCTRHWDWNPAPAKLRSGCLFEDVVSRRTVPLKLCEEGIQAACLEIPSSRRLKMYAAGQPRMSLADMGHHAGQECESRCHCRVFIQADRVHANSRQPETKHQVPEDRWRLRGAC